jgi:glycerol-3-phosphate acyltransferase PlsY
LLPVTGAGLLSFALGSLPFAWLLGRFVLGLDIRTVASRNPGATNLWRVSRPLGVLALALDIAKGAASVLAIAPLVAGPESSAGAVAAGIGAILGHVFSPLLRFRGGKGVAVGVGAVAAIVPWPTLAAVVAFVVTVAIFRYVSLGSITAAVVIVVAYFALAGDPFGSELAHTVFILTVAPLIVLRHHSNIRRLAAGTESKISFGRGRKPGSPAAE